MKLLFVSGPFRARDAWSREQNIRRAEELALILWRMGAAVICPHTNTRHFDGAEEDDLWLNGDLTMLERCDAVVMTPDWGGSVGARRERTHAILHGIPVLEWPRDVGRLRAWLIERQPLTTAKPRIILEPG
jgi:hypothetical protein